MMMFQLAVVGLNVFQLERCLRRLCSLKSKVTGPRVQNASRGSANHISFSIMQLVSDGSPHKWDRNTQ